MRKVTVNSSKKYDILIGAGLLRESGGIIARTVKPKTAVIVSDDNVFPIYGAILADSLSREGIKVVDFVFPHGESSKCLSVYGELVNRMCSEKLTRSDTVIALGGGVAGDLAGFAAATYQRGISFVQIPTSLLAAVDSSVGGKTGIDLDNGKNQVGCFHQPDVVICDTDTLSTLPPEEYSNGCAEIIKYAMIGNGKLFGSISEIPVSEQYENVIFTCVSMKRNYVEKDEFDTGCRMFLNFGHTFGHSAEALSGYTISHGKAVAMGMAVMVKACVNKGLCGGDVYDKLLKLLEQYGLPAEMPFTAADVANAAMNDKKSAGDDLRIVTADGFCSCKITTVKRNEVITWLTAGGLK